MALHCRDSEAPSRECRPRVSGLSLTAVSAARPSHRSGLISSRARWLGAKPEGRAASDDLTGG
jgi:hypothetical protein